MEIQKVLSVASLWEIIIKAQIGKLGLGMPAERFLCDHVERRILTVLEIEHLVVYASGLGRPFGRPRRLGAWGLGLEVLILHGYFV